MKPVTPQTEQRPLTQLRNVVFSLSLVTLFFATGCITASSKHEQQLTGAIAQDNAAELSRLLDESATKDDALWTVLMKASESGALKSVEMLVQRGVDVNQKRSAVVAESITRLNEGSDKYLPEAAQQMRQGGDFMSYGVVELTDETKINDYVTRASYRTSPLGHSALSLAVTKGHAPVVRYLIQQGAKHPGKVVTENFEVPMWNPPGDRSGGALPLAGNYTITGVSSGKPWFVKHKQKQFGDTCGVVETVFEVGKHQEGTLEELALKTQNHEIIEMIKLLPSSGEAIPAR